MFSLWAGKMQSYIIIAIGVGIGVTILILLIAAGVVIKW